MQGDRLLVVEDDRTLLAFDLNAPEDAWMPVWRVGPCDHRICGMPLGVGRGLVVTDEGGTIQGIRLADGKPTFSLELPSGVVPAAPAVLLERELILPVADGTIYRVPLDSRPPPNPAPGAAT